MQFNVHCIFAQIDNIVSQSTDVWRVNLEMFGNLGLKCLENLGLE